MTQRNTRPSNPTKRSGARPTRTRPQIFRREGEYWTIDYEGTLFRLKDGMGVRYLAHLLSHPDERIPCADLWSTADRPTSEAARSTERTRVAVTKRIKASVAKIARLHPALARHLSLRIRTGYFCVYVCDPNGPSSWSF